jgi:hypothetical protein
MSATNLLTPEQGKDEEVKAEVLDIISNRVGHQYQTKGGLKLEGYIMDGIELGILKPVTEQGKATLKKYVDHFEEMNRKKYTPVTTLKAPPAAGGKRNKSKKPKRRNSRSKRRKTVSKRRR